MNADKEEDKNEDVRDPQTYVILGACMAVHSELGGGFAEPVYQDALEVELGLRSIPFQREQKVAIHYKGILLKSWYKADFVCCGSILVECKAVSEISSAHEAQVLNYLKATGFARALIVNFASSRLVYRRMVRSH